MNFPNILTLSRIPLLFCIVGLLYLDVEKEKHWPATVAFVVFLITALTDWLDGYMARRLNLVSNFGKLMDALTDKILVLGMFIVLLATRIIPGWGVLCILLILSREFLITGLRQVAASKGVVLAAERSGKQKTLAQNLSVGFLLGSQFGGDWFAWSGWMNVEVAALWSWYVGVFFFVVATLLTVSSGTSYLMKYWGLIFDDEG